MTTIDPSYGINELFEPPKKGKKVSRDETAFFDFGNENEIEYGYKTTPQQKIDTIEKKSEEIQKLIDNKKTTKADIKNFLKLEKELDNIKLSLYYSIDDLTEEQYLIYDKADSIITQYKNENANAIKQYQIDTQKEYFKQEIKNLRADIENKFQTYEVAESALKVRDKIISELKISNMTEAEKNIMNIAEKIIATESTASEYLIENNITLSEKDKKILTQVCEELHRNDTEYRKPFSQKEKIYIVKNAYNDFSLGAENSEQIAAPLVDVAVREHLYNREQPKDSYYTQRTVHRGKGIKFKVDRSETYNKADEALEEISRSKQIKADFKTNILDDEEGFLPAKEKVKYHWKAVKEAIDKERKSPFAPHNIIYNEK